MPSYLTEHRVPKISPELRNMQMLLAGPDIEADSWEDAVRKLLVLIEFGMVHPETEVIGKMYHEEEWEGYYDNV